MTRVAKRLRTEAEGEGEVRVRIDSGYSVLIELGQFNILYMIVGKLLDDFREDNRNSLKILAQGLIFSIRIVPKLV